jgi:hypothetical protein
MAAAVTRVDRCRSGGARYNLVRLVPAAELEPEELAEVGHDAADERAAVQRERVVVQLASRLSAALAGAVLGVVVTFSVRYT